MTRLVAYAIAFALVSASHIDVDTAMQRAADPSQMDGLMLAQQTVEQAEQRLDDATVVPCIAEWLALHRTTFSLLDKTLYLLRSGEDYADAFDGATATRAYAHMEKPHC